MNFSEILFDNSSLIDSISFLIPLTAGWAKYRKAPGEIKFFIVIISISFLFTFTGYYTGIRFINNLLIYFAQYIVEFILYSLLFWKLLSTRFAKISILLCAVLLIFIIIINYKTIFSATSFDSYTPAFVSLSLILYCILFFNKQLDNPQITFIYKTSWFWIITGLLLYNAGNFLIFLFTNYLMYRNKGLVWLLWHLKDYFDLIKNILIMIGFLYIKNRQWKKLF